MARKRDVSKKTGRQAGKAQDIIPKGYQELLTQLKERIRSAQLRAGLAVNREMVLLYWQIGRDILQRQAKQGWGAKVIDRLATDLHHAFPDMTGFRRATSNTCGHPPPLGPTSQLCSRLLHKFPGSTTASSSTRSRTPRNAYVRRSNTAGAATSSCIGSRANSTSGKARPPPISSESLPSRESDLARDILKYPYNFEFMSLAEDAEERTCRKDCWSTSISFRLSLVPASPLSVSNTASKSAAKIFSSIC